jgi:hypothetical protein
VNFSAGKKRLKTVLKNIFKNSLKNSALRRDFLSEVGAELSLHLRGVCIGASWRLRKFYEITLRCRAGLPDFS